jgi:hypothetical protein
MGLKYDMLPPQQQGWDKSSLHFEIVSNLDGAREALRAGPDTEPRANGFLWEKFMTKPLVLSSCLLFSHHADTTSASLTFAKCRALPTPS